MRKQKIAIWLALFSTMLGTPCHADAQASSKEITLEDIWSKGIYRPATINGVTSMTKTKKKIKKKKKEKVAKNLIQ